MIVLSWAVVLGTSGSQEVKMAQPHPVGSCTGTSSQAQEGRMGRYRHLSGAHEVARPGGSQAGGVGGQVVR